MSNVRAFVAHADPGLMGMVAANYANAAPMAPEGSVGNTSLTSNRPSSSACEERSAATSC
jgi:hypothetical protein